MKQPGKIKFYAKRSDPFGRHIDLSIWNELVICGDTEVSLAQPVVFQKLTEDQAFIQNPAAVTLGMDDAQRLMDELWNVGLRPSEGTGSAGSLAATERHLQDMRSLVFKTTPK